MTNENVLTLTVSKTIVNGVSHLIVEYSGQGTDPCAMHDALCQVANEMGKKAIKQGHRNCVLKHVNTLWKARPDDEPTKAN